MTPKQKELLQPFAYTLFLWESYVSLMSDDKLREMLDACKAAGPANWYQTTDAAKILTPILIHERARRTNIKIPR